MFLLHSGWFLPLLDETQQLGHIEKSTAAKKALTGAGRPGFPLSSSTLFSAFLKRAIEGVQGVP